MNTQRAITCLAILSVPAVLFLFLHILSTHSQHIYSSTESTTQIRARPSRYSYSRSYGPPVRNLEDKYIIYRCDSSALCGGLGAREKGMINGYIISQMLRRKFGVILTKGCNFSQYILPNEVNWLIREDQLKDKTVGVWRVIDNKLIGPTLTHRDLESLFSKDVMYLENNIDYVNFLMDNPLFKYVEWARNRTHHGIFRIAFVHLFKFASHTENRYQEFLTKTDNDPLICAHLRMGRSDTLALDDDRTNRRPDLEVVIKFLKTKTSNTSKLFIATDSNEARTKMKNNFPNNFVDLDGNIVHVDRYKDRYECSGLEKVILDQYILSTCDTLLMTISGYGRLAAILRGRDDKLYIATPQTITKTLPLNPTPY